MTLTSSNSAQILQSYLWTEKYRPRSLDEITNQKEIVDRLKGFVRARSMPHCLFAGPPGTGKTTAAICLARDLFGVATADSFSELNASDERGINVVRERVKTFARTRTLGDVPFKILVLDEADNMTGDAQQALRRTMERYTETCRFILACNYSSRIIEPIQSRCAPFRFVPLSDEDVAERLRDVSRREKVELAEDGVKAIIEQSDGNVLIFFPSFYEATQYKNRIKSNVPVFLDEVGVSSQPIREEFFRLGEQGKKAVLISYMWGTLTEGVDYKDGRGRTVVIVGVGYPALNDRIRAVESAYEAQFGHGWDYAVEIPTIRKVRQALGRVVRSPSDYGVRVLLDGRYTSTSAKKLGKYSVFNIFPEEERAEIVDVAPERVKYSLLNFFNDIRKNNVKGNN